MRKWLSSVTGMAAPGFSGRGRRPRRVEHYAKNPGAGHLPGVGKNAESKYTLRLLFHRQRRQQVGKMIELTASDGHKLSAYRAEPKGKPRGGLIVVQEIFGVNGHIRSVVDGYAADGYLAVAPAFFDRAQRGVDLGYSQADIEVGRTYIPKMNWDNVIKDAAAGRDDVKSAGKIEIGRAHV